MRLANKTPRITAARQRALSVLSYGSYLLVPPVPLVNKLPQALLTSQIVCGTAAVVPRSRRKSSRETC
jgi:hypothetical protein